MKIFVLMALGIFSGFVIYEELRSLKIDIHPERIRLGIQENVLAALPIIAQRRGLFKNNGIQVDFKNYKGDEEAIKGVVDGEVDVAFTSTIPFMIESLKNKHVRILAGTGYTDKAHVVVAAKDKFGAISPQDLAGKVIGTVKDTAASVFFKIFVRIHNVPNVDVRYYDYETVIDAFLSGEVDAVALRTDEFEKVKEAIQVDDLAVFEPDFFRLYGVLASTDDLIQKKGVAAKRLMKSIVQAERFLYRNPKKSKKIILDYFGSGVDKVISKEWESYRYILSLGESLLLALESAQRLYLEDYPQIKEVRFLPLIETSLLEEEKPYGVTIRQ